MWIFAGFLGGASKDSGVVDDDIFGANLTGRRIRTFDSYQNRCPWMTLNGGNAPLRKKVE